MKKVIILFIVLTLLFTGCQTVTDESETYINGLRIRNVEPHEVKRGGSIHWINPAESPMKDETNAWVVGTITDVKEIEVIDELNDNSSQRFTKITVKVTDSIHPTSLKGKKIKIVTLISSQCDIGEPKLEAFDKGNQYLFFLERFSDDHYFKASNAAEYSLLYPPLYMLQSDASQEKIANAFNPFTSELNTNAVVEKYKATPPKSIDDFKKFLREYIK